ncbi:MAG: hypothetical protein IT382_01865 [Deltaproteobacteria bacterium]|nr:hypothetical protein [Deltaproteobacteria bacterium]
MPSSPRAVLQQAAYGRLDKAALEASCVHRDYLGALATVAGLATPVLLLVGGPAGLISGLTAGIAGIGYPIMDAICRGGAPSAAAVSVATSGARTAAGAASASNVDLGDVPAKDVATLAVAFDEAAKAAGKTLPKTAPGVAAPTIYTSTMTAAQKAAARAAIRKKLAIRANEAQARATIRARIAERAGKAPPQAPTAGGNALPWLIAAGIAAKVLL